jgi:hypothetical protein
MVTNVITAAKIRFISFPQFSSPFRVSRLYALPIIVAIRSRTFRENRKWVLLPLTPPKTKKMDSFSLVVAAIAAIQQKKFWQMATKEVMSEE